MTVSENNQTSWDASRIMKTAMEYRKHAEECRMLARGVSEGEQRHQLLEMARTWDNLAETREGLVRNHPELDTAKNPVPVQQTSRSAGGPYTS
jgi:hypothetical protein